MRQFILSQSKLCVIDFAFIEVSSELLETIASHGGLLGASFVRCELTSDQAASINKVIEGNPWLTYLSLEVNKLGREGVQLILQKLADSIHRLRWVKLSENRMPDETIYEDLPPFIAKAWSSRHSSRLQYDKSIGILLSAQYPK